MRVVLDGAKAIADALGWTDARRVRLLVESGAPVRVLHRRRHAGRGRRYLADEGALLAWLRCEERPSGPR